MTAWPCLFADFRFEAIDSGLRAGVWLALLLAGVGFLFLTYWGIYRRSGRPLAWGLMLLRAVGLLLLVLMLVKPTWTRETEEVDPGRLAVIVDNSRSMSLPDAGGAMRYDRARSAVEALKKALEADRSGPRVVVDLFDIRGKRLEGALPDKPLAESTDLTAALRETIKDMRSRPVVGLVLVSDGMDNSGRPNFRDWEDTSKPIHGLGFRAAEAGELDLAVRKPQVPERIRVHNELRVEVPVSKTGKPITEPTVSVKRGKDTVASRKVRLGPGSVEEVVPLTFTPDQPGSFVFTAAVEGATGEAYLGNNAVHFPLRVDAEPVRVIYLEGFLRYEYKYLKLRLEEDPDVELISEVRPGDPDQPGSRPGRVRLNEDLLKKADVVILGDMEGGYLTAAEYKELLRWLDGKNHSLLVLGGYKSFGPAGFGGTPLADALPVVFASGPPYQAEGFFSLQLTERGQAHPIFTLSGDRVRDAEAWEKAPRLEGMSLIERLKPAAEELAVNPRVRRDGQPAPALAVQRAAGGGQVMVLAADTTWRWSRLPRVLGRDDTLYARFWSQAVRWLAGRASDDRRPLLDVHTNRPSYDAGKRVEITVKRQRRPDVDLTGSEMRAEVTTPRGETVPLRLKADSSDPDREAVDFYPSVGGRYELTATLTAKGKAVANQTAEFLVQGTDLELANTGTNPGSLKTLADATGGVYLDVDEADQLAGKIARKERRTARTLETKYWNSPWLFGAFLLAVSAEWFIRRKNHLV